MADKPNPSLPAAAPAPKAPEAPKAPKPGVSVGVFTGLILIVALVAIAALVLAGLAAAGYFNHAPAAGGARGAAASASAAVPAAASAPSGTFHPQSVSGQQLLKHWVIGSVPPAGTVRAFVSSPTGTQAVALTEQGAWLSSDGGETYELLDDNEFWHDVLALPTSPDTFALLSPYEFCVVRRGQQVSRHALLTPAGTLMAWDGQWQRLMLLHGELESGGLGCYLLKDLQKEGDIPAWVALDKPHEDGAFPLGWRSVQYLPTLRLFLAISNDGRVFQSQDGSHWDSLHLPLDVNAQALAYSASLGRLVVTGNGTYSSRRTSEGLWVPFERVGQVGVGVREDGGDVKSERGEEGEEEDEDEGQGEGEGDEADEGVRLAGSSVEWLERLGYFVIGQERGKGDAGNPLWFSHNGKHWWTQSYQDRNMIPPVRFFGWSDGHMRVLAVGDNFAMSTAAQWES